MTFGHDDDGDRLYLKEWAKHKGVTLGEVGALFGVVPSTVSKWAGGTRRGEGLTISRLKRIAERLGMESYEELFAPPPPRQPPPRRIPARNEVEDLATLIARLTPQQRRIVIQIIRLILSLA